MARKRILLKLTGKIFGRSPSSATSTVAVSLIEQIKQLASTHQFGIVIGGGNLFRGSKEGKELSLTKETAHHVGMIATIMNGMMFQDLCEQHDVPTTLFSAISCPQVAQIMNQHHIMQAVSAGDTIIFSGGTGSPFFTTDTNAVVRSLQMKANELWKGTNIDGIYTADPAIDPNAHLMKKVSYTEAITKQLGIMDITAYCLAQEHHQKTRVLDIFAPNALLNAARDNTIGSTLS